MSAKSKLLVTGAQGFVAGSVLAQAADCWEVHALSRNAEPTFRPRVWRWHTCDPLAPAELEEVFRNVAPTAVIHTAAAADIDFCQTHPQLAWDVNVEFTRHLAGLCRQTGARLVFCSTDTIFDGENAPYAENSSPAPVNRYAETKVAAEQLLADLGPHCAIARLALVIGLPLLGAGNSFLVRMLATLKEGRPITVPEREVRTPVDVITAGRALLELAAGDHHGSFHLCGLSRVNRVELSRAIARKFALPEQLVVPQTGSATPGRAVRPRDVSLVCTRTAELRTPLRTLDEGLSLIMENAKNL